MRTAGLILLLSLATGQASAQNFESSKLTSGVVVQGTAFESSKMAPGVVVQGTAFESSKMAPGVVVQTTGFQSSKISVGIVLIAVKNGGVVPRAPLTHW
jgi:hypothetical protein